MREEISLWFRMGKITEIDWCNSIKKHAIEFYCLVTQTLRLV